MAIWVVNLQEKKMATCNFTFSEPFFSPVLLNTKVASFVMPWPYLCGNVILTSGISFD